MAKFNKLDVPSQWKDEFTKYPHGYTIFEALCKWVKQVDNMVDNINNWNTYLDNFVESFEFELQEEVQSTIERWQSEGLLDGIIESALNTELDNINAQLADYATHKADYVKHRNIYISGEPPTTEDGEEGDIFLTPKQVQSGFFTPVVTIGGVVADTHSYGSSGRYTVIDKTVFLCMNLYITKPDGAEGVLEVKLPFVSSNTRPHSSIAVADTRSLNFPDGAKTVFINIDQNTNIGSLRFTLDGLYYRQVNDTHFVSNTVIRFNGFYFID